MLCVNCGCDAEVSDKGRMINRCAWLGSQVVQLRERIPEVEKLARKTPPKSLKSEVERVKKAKEELPKLQKQLTDMEAEWTTLKVQLDWR